VTYSIAAPVIFVWGAVAQESGHRNPLVWSRGQAPVVGPGDKSTRSLKQFADIVYRF